jgi:DNA-binding transcriptional LysR family regulator
MFDLHASPVTHLALRALIDKKAETSLKTMNVHHLELFYYVARHGGIMEAVRNIPYGIQQPAVSGQVAQLEEHLGVTLFRRRPFALTGEGEKLYEFIAPFFAGLEKVAGELQGGRARHIRIGASTIVLRDHLPELFQGVRKKFPGLKLSVREGFPAQLEELLQKDEIDLAVTLIERKPAQGVRSLPLFELPMVLMVGNNSPVKSAEELWRRDKIDETLICLPSGESLCKNFQQRLGELGVDWFPGIEASSTDLIEAYVANGLGIGVSVSIPKKSLPPNVRTLPLDGFPPVVIGALWRGRKTPLIELFLEESQRRVKRLDV